MDRKAALKQFVERLEANSALRKELGADPEGVVAREMSWLQWPEEVGR